MIPQQIGGFPGEDQQVGKLPASGQVPSQFAKAGQLRGGPPDNPFDERLAGALDHLLTKRGFCGGEVLLMSVEGSGLASRSTAALV